MNMAERITAKVFASVGLADPVCPALCYYATYNRIRSEKHICVYPFNEHDGARDTHIERELGVCEGKRPIDRLKNRRFSMIKAIKKGFRAHLM